MTLAAITHALAQGVQPADLRNDVVAPVDHRISYASGELHFGELRLPKSASRYPLLILVHGGCWADRLPTYPIDLSRVAVAGHSSGGQLALWIAARPKLNRSSELFAKGRD